MQAILLLSAQADIANGLGLEDMACVSAYATTMEGYANAI